MYVITYAWSLPAMVLLLSLVCLYQQLKALGLFK